MLREKSRTNHYIAAVIGIAVLVFLDQFTKCLAIDRLKGQSPFIIIKEVFQLEYLENRGAAFGLFQNFEGFDVSEPEDLLFPKRHRHMRCRLVVLSQGAYGEAFSAASAMCRIYCGGGLWKLY